MNDRLDRILSRNRLETLRDAGRLVHEVAVDPRVLTALEEEALRELAIAANRLLWRRGEDR
jgi:hypothetical protein